MAKRIADNVIPISTPLDTSFFKAWLDFTEPLHNLTEKEKLVMACYLKEYYELTKVISDDAILIDVLSSTSTRQKIQTMVGIKSAHLQAVLHAFKKKGLMLEGKINPKLIPAITSDVVDSKEFRLMIRFSLDENN